MLEVKNATNKRSAQTKLFALISIPGGQDAEAFDITVNMFNVDSAFRKECIGFPFFRRQCMVFGSLNRGGAVGMEFGNSLISFVCQNLCLGQKMDAAILQQGKIMLFSCCCFDTDDIQRLCVCNNLYFQGVSFLFSGVILFLFF